MVRPAPPRWKTLRGIEGLNRTKRMSKTFGGCKKLATSQTCVKSRLKYNRLITEETNKKETTNVKNTHSDPEMAGTKAKTSTLHEH